MVSRTQLARIERRIEALAFRDDWRVAVIIQRKGETEDEMDERHFRDHHEDRGANHIVRVVFVASEDGRPHVGAQAW